MNASTLLSLRFLLGSATALVLASCTPQLGQVTPNTNNPNNTVESTVSAPETKKNMFAVPPALSAEEASKYRADLPLTKRLELAQELAGKMSRNGMQQMQAIFPDLKKAYDIPDQDPRNLMQAGPEALYVSSEGNLAVSVCVEADSPLHLFKTTNPLQADFTQVKQDTEKMMQEEEGKKKNSGITSFTEDAPQYLSYSQATYDSLVGKKPVALFFHADWCPVCRKMETDIKGDLGNFPKGTKLIQVDYDTATALKQQYGITMQSIVVVLNAQGEVVAKLNGPGNDTLKKALAQSM